MKVTEIVFLSCRRVQLVVEIPENGAYTTSDAPRIPRLLFKLLPHMATQRCYNDDGHSFRREAEATEIPHLFEHLILEIQDQVRRGIGTPFAGETHWNWTVDPRGRFYVTVDYDDEVVALASIRLAERIINALDSKDITQIDMPREISRLREISKLTRRSAGPRRAQATRFNLLARNEAAASSQEDAAALPPPAEPTAISQPF